MKVSTCTFGEVMNTRYIVPPYQRAYSWDRTLWQLLFQDFTDLYADASAQSGNGHFFGAIVTKKSSRDSATSLIIDGQQRTTTLNLLALGLLNAIRRISHELKRDPKKAHEDSDVWAKIDNAFLAHPNDADSLHSTVSFTTAGERYPKIKLGRFDRDRFEALVKAATEVVDKKGSTDYVHFTIEESERGPESNRGKGSKDQTQQEKEPHLMLERAFEFFSHESYEFIRNAAAGQVDDAASSEYLDVVANIIRKMIAVVHKRFSLVIMETDLEDSPQDIFESLNARSKPLESFDLLKNYVILKAGTKVKDALLDEDADGDQEELEAFYDEYFADFELSESQEVDAADIEEEEDEESSEDTTVKTATLSAEVPFWFRDKKLQTDRSTLIAVNHRTVFMNYWLDASYHPQGQVVKYDGSFGPGKKVKLGDGEDYELLMNEENTEHRYKNSDSIYRAYKQFFNAKGWGQKVRRADVAEQIRDDVTIFSQGFSEGGKFYKDCIEYIENKDADKSLKDYPSLDALDDSLAKALVGFIERVVIGLELRALWKQVLWVFRNRERLSVEDAVEIIETMESWSVRRSLFSKYKVYNLNTATVRIMKYLLDKEYEENENASSSMIENVNLRSYLQAVKSTVDYMYFPKNKDFLIEDESKVYAGENDVDGVTYNALDTSSCKITATNVGKISSILFALEKFIAEKKEADGESEICDREEGESPTSLSAKSLAPVFVLSATPDGKNHATEARKELSGLVGIQKKKQEEYLADYDRCSTLGNIVLVGDVNPWSQKHNKVDAGIDFTHLTAAKKIAIKSTGLAINAPWGDTSTGGTSTVKFRNLKLARLVLERWVY